MQKIKYSITEYPCWELLSPISNLGFIEAFWQETGFRWFRHYTRPDIVVGELYLGTQKIQWIVSVSENDSDSEVTEKVKDEFELYYNLKTELVTEDDK